MAAVAAMSFLHQDSGGGVKVQQWSMPGAISCERTAMHHFRLMRQQSVPPAMAKHRSQKILCRRQAALSPPCILSVLFACASPMAPGSAQEGCTRSDSVCCSTKRIPSGDPAMWHCLDVPAVFCDQATCVPAAFRSRPAGMAGSSPPNLHLLQPGFGLL